jgi:hypothetical protein
MPDKPAIPKFGIERQIEEQRATPLTAPGTPAGPRADPSDPMISGPNALGYALADKLTVGGLPWLRDKVAELAGVKQPNRFELRETLAKEHPWMYGAGSAAGQAAAMLPFVKGGQMLGLGGSLASRALLGSGAAAGADIAEQAGHAALDDRPYSPGQTALAGVTGAVGPAVIGTALASKGVLPFAVSLAKQSLPGPAQAALSTVQKALPGFIPGKIPLFPSAPTPPVAPPSLLSGVPYTAAAEGGVQSTAEAESQRRRKPREREGSPYRPPR